MFRHHAALALGKLTCQAQGNVPSFHVREAPAAFPNAWRRHGMANAYSVSPTSAPWGRSGLYASRQVGLRRRASWTAVHSPRVRPPSRQTPFQLVFCPCCHGRPGAIPGGATCGAGHQGVPRCARHAGPVSLLTSLGAPRAPTSAAAPGPSPPLCASGPRRAPRPHGGRPRGRCGPAAAPRWARQGRQPRARPAAAPGAGGAF